MKKVIFLALVVLFVFVQGSYAEPYISPDFPPDEVLIKACKDTEPPIVYLGKTKKIENVYDVFYMYSNKKRLISFQIIKTDKNYWFTSGNEIAPGFLEK
jgi:hypothetical protein